MQITIFPLQGHDPRDRVTPQAPSLQTLREGGELPQRLRTTTLLAHVEFFWGVLLFVERLLRVLIFVIFKKMVKAIISELPMAITIAFKKI